MDICHIIPDDNRVHVNCIYEEGLHSADRGILPQAYLDSIPNVAGAPITDNMDVAGEFLL